MFEKFGELTLGELNNTAAGLKEEGDTESLKALAEENGLEEWELDEYLSGTSGQLAYPFTAAAGRIKAEYKELEKGKNGFELMPYRVIRDMLESMIGEEGMADAVMKKGKRMSEIYDEMKEYAEKNKAESVAGTDEDLRKIIRAYYLKDRKEMKNAVSEVCGK